MSLEAIDLSVGIIAISILLVSIAVFIKVMGGCA